MKKTIKILFIFSFIFLLAACSKSSDDKPANSSDNNSENSQISFQDKLTSNKWNVMFNGQSYGTLKFNSDGTCVKTGEGGIMETNGTYKIDGNNITLSFPDEGDPFSGTLSMDGKNVIAKYMDGAITYTYTPMQ